MEYKNVVRTAVIVIVALVVGGIIGAGVRPAEEGTFGATANRPVEYIYDFVNGFFVSGSQVFDSTGNITVKGEVNTFGDAVTSTVQVGGASKSGCIILGDSANGASPVYITASGATVTASTTKPAACQTTQ